MKTLFSFFTFVVLSCITFSSQAAQCDWYGTTYALCTSQATGWGWENGQSCVGYNACPSVISTSSTTTSTQCNWDGTIFPLCTSQATGWGWENSKSCVGYNSCPSTVASNTSSSSSSTSTTTTASQCDWHGTTYALCTSQATGWGWENNQSCVGYNSCPSTVANNSSSSSGATSTSGSCPTNLSCPSGMSCGCYSVSGLGANKVAYKNAGADRSFLASAMMETEKMDTNYTYGDGKSGDAFNAGATKQNWGMMRQCYSAWRGLGANDYSVSAAMNNDRSLDVTVYNTCRNYFGSNWFAGHRNGSSGLSNPNTQDINNFKIGYEWTYNNLSGHETDDIRFWVDIPAI